jgi:hypothetical protein
MQNSPSSTKVNLKEINAMTASYALTTRWSPRPSYTAQRHLTGVIDRARTFNADGSHLIDITELVVFGSYLDPGVQHLGDLDLGVAFRSRTPDTTSTEGQSEIRLGYARASGRRFDTFFDRLSWPEHEALLILSNRSAAINITLENPRNLTDRWEVIYSFEAQIG